MSFIDVIAKKRDGHALCRFFDLRVLLLEEPRRADDEGLAVGEVLDSGFRGGELYEDFGILGGIFGRGDAYLAGAAELTEIGAGGYRAFGSRTPRSAGSWIRSSHIARKR
jgi:hypothetical protein